MESLLVYLPINTDFSNILDNSHEIDMGDLYIIFFLRFCKRERSVL